MSVCTHCPDTSAEACSDCEVISPMLFCTYCGKNMGDEHHTPRYHDYGGDICKSCNDEYNQGYLTIADFVTVRTIA